MDRHHCWEDVIGPEERLVAKNYVGKRFVGTRPALLLIDLYTQVFGDRREPLEQAMASFPASCGPTAWDAIGPITEVLDQARALELPIAYTTGESRPEANAGGATLRRRDGDDPTRNGYEIKEEFAPQESDYVVYKTRASGFFGTPLGSWLRMRDVDTLVVCGESTSGCVRASVVDAYSHGFKVIVCEPGVFDRSPLAHKVNLFDMHHKYATVMDLEDTKRYLADPSASDGLVSAG